MEYFREKVQLREIVQSLGGVGGVT
jgi:hypothetical protein